MHHNNTGFRALNRNFVAKFYSLTYGLVLGIYNQVSVREKFFWNSDD